MDTGAAGSIIAMKTLVYQVILVLYSLVMVIWKLPFFQTNISGFSFVTILGLLCNSTFIFLVALFCISERLTDSILYKAIWLFHKLQLSVFHGNSFLLRKSWSIWVSACFLQLSRSLLPARSLILFTAVLAIRNSRLAQ